MKNRTHVNHSHISGEIIGYAHRYCNYKVRENQTKISVVAHNLFRFDFFFLLKGLRTGVRKTKDITIDGKNPSLVQLSALFRKISPPLKYSRLQILGNFDFQIFKTFNSRDLSLKSRRKIFVIFLKFSSRDVFFNIISFPVMNNWDKFSMA